MRRGTGCCFGQPATFQACLCHMTLIPKKIHPRFSQQYPVNFFLNAVMCGHPLNALTKPLQFATHGCASADKIKFKAGL